MPTQDWFKANPKVSAYLSTELNQALQSWMKEHRIKKVSVGLTTILEQFLGVNQDKLPVNQDAISLKQFQELKQRIEVLEKSILKVDQSKPKVEQKSLKIQVITEEKELKNTVAQGKPKSSSKIKEKTSNKLVSQTRSNNSPTQDSEWLTSKEAYEEYGKTIKYGTFRKMNAAQLKERFGLESDESRKGKGRKAMKWIKKLPQAD